MTYLISKQYFSIFFYKYRINKAVWNIANLFLTWSVTPDIVKKSPTHADTDAQTDPIFARALGSGSRGAWLSDTTNHIQTSKLILELQQNTKDIQME